MSGNKTTRYKYWLAFFIICLISLQAYTQSIRIISTQDGLPQSFVSGLEQDKQGFVWIGTRNGLARYDGTKFINFQHDIHDSLSLASNIITWLQQDDSNHILIEYESGELDIFNPATQKVRHFINVQSATNTSLHFIRRGWLFDSHGIFWGITKENRLYMFDSSSKKLVFINADKEPVSNYLRGLQEDSRKQVWVLSANNLSCFIKQANQFKNFKLPYTQNFNDADNADERVVDLHERNNGELMWADSKALFFFNSITNQFHTTPLPEQLTHGVKWIRSGANGMEYFEANNIVYAYEDGKGLKPFSGAGMSQARNARSFLIDRAGLIWVGTNAEGIHQINPNNPFFNSFSYKKDFGSDALAQELGLSVENTFNWTNKDAGFSYPGYHLRSLYDDKHQLWIGLKETICYRDENNNWNALPKVSYITDTLSGDIGIKGISIAPDRKLYVIGYNGNVVEYDDKTKKWNLYIPLRLLRNSFGENVLPQDMIVDSKKIWITTANDGLIYIDIPSKKINQLKAGTAAVSLPTNQLLQFKPDPLRPNILWIGSYQGLIALDKNTLQCTTFSVGEGLPDNTIYSIQTDEKKNLWLSTNKGLCRFNPVTHEVRIFRTQNGLSGDEFNRFHSLKLPDNELAFGGTAGWVKFNPLSFKDDNYEPQVLLTGLNINYVEASKDSSSKSFVKPLNFLDTINLRYDQNTFTFLFSALQFNQPQDNLYRYRLEGYDKDWIRAGPSHEANYTHIPPGNYAFYINASNTTGKWSQHIKKITVIITPPWWASNTAYVCYTIIITSLIWGFIRYRITQGIMKREIALKENESQQMKELDEMKTRFFSNITHEFRTPLTLIIGPAEELKKPGLNSLKQNQFADTIIKSAKQLLVLVNRLLDLSRLEAKALKIYEQKGNPSSIVGSIIYSFELYAKANEVQLSFTDNTKGIKGWFYPDALERIVYNLVSNALKFTPPGGKVSASLEHKNDSLILTVNDTGIGINENQLPFIFERYYQGDKATVSAENQTKASTGIGLALVKELVELQNGNINVQSTAANMQASGTQFIVTLPFRIDELNATETVPLEQPISSLENIPEYESSKLPLVLLVEDNADITEFLESSLSDNYKVKKAENGVAGFDAAISLMPDIIVSDVLMPEMDGFTFCAKIKNDIRTSHIPVILLTAKASQENLIEGLSKGADDYLTKPFHPSEFLLRIHNLLERQKRLCEKIKSELSSPETIQPELKEEKVQDPFIQTLYTMVDEHLDDPLFGVDQMVEAIKISRTSLHRKLKAITGTSASEFIRLYRLKRATGFLKQGYNSTDTAYHSGFGSPAYFTKCFRETYGMTPGEYIRKENVQ